MIKINDEFKTIIKVNDIQSFEDIEKLVDHFYNRLLIDKRTSSFFEHLDLEKHLPKIADFWAFILLDKPGYIGNVFDKHAHLGLKPSHFEIWIGYWKQSVDELHTGPKADLAKQRADILSYTFQSKLFPDDTHKII